jgi:hypothetical protein
MIYIVLGCHKSGTTLIARTLHESGIAMVGDDDAQGDYDQSGFYERLRWVELNQHILGHGDPAEDHPVPARVFATQRQREQMGRWIACCESRHTDWGFKDPRTCLTYPIWREELPEHHLIGVYRLAASVAVESDASVDRVQPTPGRRARGAAEARAQVPAAPL